jgi:hypothetical protein
MFIDKEKNNTYTRIYIITDNYIDNIKNIINNTQNKKELKKYNLWYIFVTYIKIIFKLYLHNYDNINHFITITELIHGNSKITTPDDTLSFYNILIPNKKYLCGIQKYLDKNMNDFINDIIHKPSTLKKLSKMIKNIYLIIYNESVICWQFKSDTNITRLKYSSGSNLTIIHNISEIYIKYKIIDELYQKYPITNNTSQDYKMFDIDSICSDIYADDNSICNDESRYNKQSHTIQQPDCDYAHETIYIKTSQYDYIYTLIKNSSILYLYIIAVIIKFYINVNILKFKTVKKLLYIINCNR